MEKSQEYIIAETVLGRLATDPQLKSFVYPDVWDDGEQTDRIAAAARSYRGQITVGVGLPNIAIQDKEQGHLPRMEAHIVISSLVVPNVTTSKSGLSAPAFLSSLLERSMTIVKRWAYAYRPNIAGTYKGVSMIGAMDTLLKGKESLEDIRGKSFIVVVPYDLSLQD